MMYVLDTCVLLWWTLDPENLSPLAAKHCKNIDTQGACIASVSLWEIGVKIQKGKLNIGMPIRSFAKLLSQVNIEQVPVDTDPLARITGSGLGASRSCRQADCCACKMKLTDKQILITGADGFIGSHLTETLLDMGCRVRALSLYNSLRSLFCGVSRLKPVAEWTNISI